MDCPACGRALSKTSVDGVEVDVCDGGCGGMWFDWMELRKLDEPHEATGIELLQVDAPDAMDVDHDRRWNCPRDGAVMMRHFFSVKRQVEVDECPGCGGFWLDAGELRTIRSQFNDEDDRKQAAGAYFHDVFGTKMAAMRAAGDEKAAQARRIAHVFRFVTPSYWIPGDQDWGAF